MQRGAPGVPAAEPPTAPVAGRAPTDVRQPTLAALISALPAESDVQMDERYVAQVRDAEPLRFVQRALDLLAPSVPTADSLSLQHRCAMALRLFVTMQSELPPRRGPRARAAGPAAGTAVRRAVPMGGYVPVTREAYERVCSAVTGELALETLSRVFAIGSSTGAGRGTEMQRGVVMAVDSRPGDPDVAVHAAGRLPEHEARPEMAPFLPAVRDVGNDDILGLHVYFMGGLSAPMRRNRPVAFAGEEIRIMMNNSAPVPVRVTVLYYVDGGECRVLFPSAMPVPTEQLVDLLCASTLEPQSPAGGCVQRRVLAIRPPPEWPAMELAPGQLFDSYARDPSQYGHVAGVLYRQYIRVDYTGRPEHLLAIATPTDGGRSVSREVQFTVVRE